MDKTHFPIIAGFRRSPGATWRLAFLVLLASLPCAAQAPQPIHYVVDLRAPNSHLVQVTMNVPAAPPATEIQIPTWNCLYQIRDFVKDVQDLQGECDGQRVELGRVDLDTWRGPNRGCSRLEFRYAVYAHGEGPFSSMLDSEHAFLNLAMLLFYLPKDRGRETRVKILLPEGWKLATLLDGEGDEFPAKDYDSLADSPVEAGHFAEFSYTQELSHPDASPEPGGKRATFHVVIHADPADYSAGRLLDSIRKITAEETALMHDLPFERYTFILDFPREAGPSGGMEHRNGAAITVPASVMRGGQGYLEDVLAHEFFHAWNVKRIRPQSLEPIDYIHGNDTRDLWFCEGLTSTYAELVLLRAGLINRETFYNRLASAIQVLQERPARRYQSVETSGREAWLEKYADYYRPERSVSYYNKGELLGFLLDLGIRNASHNRASLDDVMRRLNQDFARQGRFYTLADLRAIISQFAPSFDVDRFLADYVQGTQELDYATYLGYAGVRLATSATELPAAGFTMSRTPSGVIQVESVEPGSDAQRAGLKPGDVLLKADGEPLPASVEATLPRWRPAQTVELQIARGGKSLLIKFKIGVSQQISYRVNEEPHPDPGQLRVREGWLKGQTAPASAPVAP
jgi:predicted metalloprotease with PDZ domain